MDSSVIGQFYQIFHRAANLYRQSRYVSSSIILLAVFLIPMLLAGLLWLSPRYLPTHHTNRGALFTPAIPVSQLTLQNLQGKSQTLAQLRGKWLFLYWNMGKCDEICRANLVLLGQAHQALGKDQGRVATVLVLGDDNQAKSGHLFPREQQKFAVFTAKATQQAAFIKKLYGSDVQRIHKNQQVYIIDPIGNVVLEYHVPILPKDLYQDIGLLLRASQIG